MFPETAMDSVGFKQNWNDETRLHIALEYIANQGDDQAFEDFLRETAREENEAAVEFPPETGEDDSDQVACPHCGSNNNELLDDNERECYDCGKTFIHL